MPAPKLTGLGCWLLSTLALLAFAFVDQWLFDGAQTAYGVFFVLVSVGAAMWVRPYDLITAPVALPIAFTLGVLPIHRGSDGVGGLLMGVFTVLALNAPWLYAGTLVCVLIVLVRWVVLIVRRRASRQVSRQVNRQAGRPEKRRPGQDRRQPAENRPRQVARQPERRAQPSRPPRSPRCSEAEPARSRP
ncbi:DUF6542 domain-containing protein [Streptomyces sp. NPDC101393]|uniref:DUF6542 domain-containing protein n=1 Tax=Streptomyces sp. NPDC101393 TaxID=3366141 RepID=UPI003822328F